MLVYFSIGNSRSLILCSSKLSEIILPLAVDLPYVVVSGSTRYHSMCLAKLHDQTNFHKISVSILCNLVVLYVDTHIMHTQLRET